MLCPNCNQELSPRSFAYEGVNIAYHYCPNCFGNWIKAFDANYLKSFSLQEKSHQKIPQKPRPSCPECGILLTPSRGENIPPAISSWRCPQNHGYFFPAGELTKFKKAQEAKVAYHKLWQIPLSSLAGTLLTAFLGLILSWGLILGVIESQRRQAITSQAQQIITFRKIYTSPTSPGVTFVAATTIKTSLTFWLDGHEGRSMYTADGFWHVVRLPDVAAGEHSYYFSFTHEGKTLRSPSYSLMKD